MLLEVCTDCSAARRESRGSTLTSDQIIGGLRRRFVTLAFAQPSVALWLRSSRLSERPKTVSVDVDVVGHAWWRRWRARHKVALRRFREHFDALAQRARVTVTVFAHADEVGGLSQQPLRLCNVQFVPIALTGQADGHWHPALLVVVVNAAQELLNAAQESLGVGNVEVAPVACGILPLPRGDELGAEETEPDPRALMGRRAVKRWRIRPR